MKTNIALIGFMGAGKSEVGKALAQRLGRKFIDLDFLIEKRAGKSISRIFLEDGEAAFRELEVEVTKEISQVDNSVIACGGGIILNQVNIDRLRRKAVIVYLSADPSLLLKRVQGSEDLRPLLKGEDKERRVRELLSFREPLYKRAADIEVDTSKLDVEAVVERIISELKKDESFNL